MHRTPFFLILVVWLLGAAAAAVLAITLSTGWWAVFAILVGIAIVWLAWGPDEWWSRSSRAAGWSLPERTPREQVSARRARSAPSVTILEDEEYQPQCSALRNDGIQCRNSARDGSKYCSSHFGYQPRTAEGVVRQTDTSSLVASRDTMTSYAGDAVATTSRGAQCQALTAAGGGRAQCKNTVRAGSQFCVAHAGYRSPTPRAVVEGRDSKPRWTKAPDTLPSTRKSGA